MTDAAEAARSIEQIAHQTEVSADVETSDGDVVVFLYSGEPDMVGWFFEELTEEYTIDVEVPAGDPMEIRVRGETLSEELRESGCCDFWNGDVVGGRGG